MDAKKFTEGDIEKLFEEAATRKGAIPCSIHFDAYGEEADVVKHALVDLIGRLAGEKGVIYCKGEVEEPYEKEIEGKKAYSTFAEAKVLFDSIETSVAMCMKYGPVSVEVLKPRELKLDMERIQGLLLGVSSISQQYTEYFTKRVMSKEEFEKFQKILKERVEAGKKLVEKHQQKK